LADLGDTRKDAICSKVGRAQKGDNINKIEGGGEEGNCDLQSNKAEERCTVHVRGGRWTGGDVCLSG